MMHLEKLFTSKQVCELLAIKQRALASWVADGVIPSILIGRHSRRFRESDIRRIVEGSADTKTNLQTDNTPLQGENNAA